MSCQLNTVPGGRQQVGDDDVLLLGPDVVRHDSPGRLGLLLVLDDVILDGTSSIWPPMKMEREVAGVDADHLVKVDLLWRRPQSWCGNARTGLTTT